MKNKLKNNGKVYGTFLTSAGWGGFLEIFAHHGYDFVVFDTEHGSIGYEKLEELARTARLLGLHPIVRVADNQYGLIARAMDMGFPSVMIPRVETAEQAAYAVNCIKYPPLGVRGSGGFHGFSEPDKLLYLQESNANGLVVIQIESQLGIDNLDAIVEVAGVDVIFIGPNDLSIQLGVHAQTSHPKVKEAIRAVMAKCAAKQIPVGTQLGGPQDVKDWGDEGMQVLSISSEISMVNNKAKELIEFLKK
jgi:4-hydroxy-2-oxoheptanedioate aldolase